MNDKFTGAWTTWSTSTDIFPTNDNKNASAIAHSTIWKLSLYTRGVNRDVIDATIKQAQDAGYETAEPGDQGKLHIRSEEIYNAHNISCGVNDYRDLVVDARTCVRNAEKSLRHLHVSALTSIQTQSGTPLKELVIGVAALDDIDRRLKEMTALMEKIRKLC